MSVWSWLSERRRWGAEIKDVPQQQFRWERELELAQSTPSGGEK